MLTIEQIFNILQISAALALTVLTCRLISSVKKERSGGTLTLIFFAFSLVTLVVSDLYWMTYGILRPDTRMPLSAAEIGECGFMLLLAASLDSAKNKSAKAARAQRIAAAVSAIAFSSASTALWIGWNGSYLTNLLSGASLAFLLCNCLFLLLENAAFKRAEWIALGVWAFLLSALQGATFFAPEKVTALLDVFCYLLIFIGLALILLKIVIAFVRKAPAKRQYALCSFLFCASIAALYMSAGAMYNAVFTVLTFSLILIYLALRRAVAGEKSEKSEISEKSEKEEKSV